MGYLAGFALNSGSNNVFIGSNACGSITAANNFFCFGNSAGTPLAFNSNSGNVILGKESGNSQVTIHGDLYVTGNIINANAGINTGTQNSDIDQISEITQGTEENEAGGGVANSPGIESNAENIAKNTTAIAENLSLATADTVTNTASIADNSANILTNKVNIATNTADIDTNKNNIATNTADIDTNKNSIATNTADIDTNKNNIATNTLGLTTNSAAITTNTGSIANNVVRLDNLAALTASNASRVEGLETLTGLMQNEYRSGIASSIALSQIQYAASGFSIGVGHGEFKNKDEMAVGIGYGGQFNEDVGFQFQFGTSGDSTGFGFTVNF